MSGNFGFERIELANIPSGIYTVVIDSRGADGEFFLHLSCESTNCSEATPLECNTPRRGDTRGKRSYRSNYPECGPFNGCFTGSNDFSGSFTGPEEYWRFTAPESGNYVVELTGDSPSEDLELFILNDCCQTEYNPHYDVIVLTATPCSEECTNAEISQDGSERQELFLSAGQTIWIVVDGFLDSQGSYTIEVNCQQTLDCNDFIPLACGETIVSDNFSFGSNPASNKYNKSLYSQCDFWPNSSSDFNGNDRVFRVVKPSNNGFLNITLYHTPTSDGGSTDLSLFVFRGCGNNLIRCYATSQWELEEGGDIIGEYFFDGGNPLPAGEYFIVVDGASTDRQSEFSITATCGRLDCTDAMPLPCGINLTDQSLSEHNNTSIMYGCDTDFNPPNDVPTSPGKGEVGYIGNEKVYTFSLEETEEITVRLTGGLRDNFDLFLFDSCSEINCLSSGRKATRPSGFADVLGPITLSPGTYYVVVEGSRQSGDRVTPSDGTFNIKLDGCKSCIDVSDQYKCLLFHPIPNSVNYRFELSASDFSEYNSNAFDIRWTVDGEEFSDQERAEYNPPKDRVVELCVEWTIPGIGELEEQCFRYCKKIRFPQNPYECDYLWYYPQVNDGPSPYVFKTEQEVSSWILHDDAGHIEYLTSEDDDFDANIYFSNSQTFDNGSSIYLSYIYEEEDVYIPCCRKFCFDDYFQCGYNNVTASFIGTPEEVSSGTHRYRFSADDLPAEASIIKWKAYPINDAENVIVRDEQIPEFELLELSDGDGNGYTRYAICAIYEFEGCLRICCTEICLINPYTNCQDDVCTQMTELFCEDFENGLGQLVTDNSNDWYQVTGPDNENAVLRNGFLEISDNFNNSNKPSYVGYNIPQATFGGPYKLEIAIRDFNQGAKFFMNHGFDSSLGVFFNDDGTGDIDGVTFNYPQNSDFTIGFVFNAGSAVSVLISGMLAAEIPLIGGPTSIEFCGNSGAYLVDHICILNCDESCEDETVLLSSPGQVAYWTNSEGERLVQFDGLSEINLPASTSPTNNYVYCYYWECPDDPPLNLSTTDVQSGCWLNVCCLEIPYCPDEVFCNSTYFGTTIGKEDNYQASFYDVCYDTGSNDFDGPDDIIKFVKTSSQPVRIVLTQLLNGTPTSRESNNLSLFVLDENFSLVDNNALLDECKGVNVTPKIGEIYEDSLDPLPAGVYYILLDGYRDNIASDYSILIECEDTCIDISNSTDWCFNYVPATDYETSNEYILDFNQLTAPQEILSADLNSIVWFEDDREIGRGSSLDNYRPRSGTVQICVEWTVPGVEGGPDICYRYCKEICFGNPFDCDNIWWYPKSHNGDFYTFVTQSQNVVSWELHDELGTLELVRGDVKNVDFDLSVFPVNKCVWVTLTYFENGCVKICCRKICITDQHCGQDLVQPIFVGNESEVNRGEYSYRFQSLIENIDIVEWKAFPLNSTNFTLESGTGSSFTPSAFLVDILIDAPAIYRVCIIYKENGCYKTCCIDICLSNPYLCNSGDNLPSCNFEDGGVNIQSTLSANSEVLYWMDEAGNIIEELGNATSLIGYIPENPEQRYIYCHYIECIEPELPSFAHKSDNSKNVFLGECTYKVCCFRLPDCEEQCYYNCCRNEDDSWLDEIKQNLVLACAENDPSGDIVDGFISQGTYNGKCHYAVWRPASIFSLNKTVDIYSCEGVLTETRSGDIIIGFDHFNTIWSCSNRNREECMILCEHPDTLYFENFENLNDGDLIANEVPMWWKSKDDLDENDGVVIDMNSHQLGDNMDEIEVELKLGTRTSGVYLFGMDLEGQLVENGMGDTILFEGVIQLKSDTTFNGNEIIYEFRLRNDRKAQIYDVINNTLVAEFISFVPQNLANDIFQFNLKWKVDLFNNTVEIFVNNSSSASLNNVDIQAIFPYNFEIAALAIINDGSQDYLPIDNVCIVRCDAFECDNKYRENCNLLSIETIGTSSDGDIDVSLNTSNIPGQIIGYELVIEGEQDTITLSSPTFVCPIDTKCKLYVIYLDEDGCEVACCYPLYIPSTCDAGFEHYYSGNGEFGDLTYSMASDPSITPISYFIQELGVQFQPNESFSFQSPGSYTICCLYYDNDANCYRLCCIEVCIDDPLFSDSCEDVFFDYFGKGDYQLKVTSRENPKEFFEVISWRVDSRGGAYIGNNNPQNFNRRDFGIADDEEVLISVRYRDSEGCIRVCCRRMCPVDGNVTDPDFEECDDIDFRYTGEGLIYEFCYNLLAPMIFDIRITIPRSSDPTNMPNPSGTAQILDGPDMFGCYQIDLEQYRGSNEPLTICFEYIDENGCVRQCCKTICDFSDPISSSACNNITTSFEGSLSNPFLYKFDLDVPNLDTSYIDWTIHKSNGVNLQNIPTSDTSLILDFDDFNDFNVGDRVCVTVEYFDPESLCFKTCCICFCLSDPFSCGVIESSIVGDNLILELVESSASNIIWTVENGQEISNSTSLSMLDIVDDQVIVCASYFDEESQCYRYCCKEICVIDDEIFCSDYEASIRLENGDILFEYMDVSPGPDEESFTMPDGTTVFNRSDVSVMFGEYTYCLIFENGCSMNEQCCVTSCIAPLINCSIDDLTYTVSMTNEVSFTYTGDDHVTDYKWIFGDGSTSTSGSTVGHQYSSSGGSFEVCLQVSNECHDCEVCINITVPNLNGEMDEDGDGWSTPLDCDDTDPNINPDAMEIPCNGIDEDCDPSNDCSSSVLFKIGTSCGSIGQTVLVPVRVFNFVNIDSAELIVELNSPMGRIIRISSDALPNRIEHSLLNQNPTTLSSVRLNSNGSPVSLVDSSVLFNIEIEILDNGFSESSLSFNEAISELAVYNGSLIEIPSSWEQGHLCLESLKVISGQISTNNADVVSGVNLVLEGDSNIEVGTDDAGAFVIDAPTGSNFVLSATKNDDYLNGVSPQDILLIKRHLGGVEGGAILSPYDRIAADIDDNGQISLVDINQLRSLILGNSTSFPSNDSWRFVVSSEPISMPNPNDVMVPDFIETISYLPLLADQVSQDFVGVKIGDLNGSVISSFHDKGEIRSLDFTTIRIDDQEFKKGEVVHATFRSKDFIDKASFLLELNFSEQLEFSEFTKSELSDFNESNIGKAFIDESKLIILWVDDSNRGISLDNDEVLFELSFTALEDGKLSELLEVSNMYRKSEILSSDLSSSDVLFEFDLTTSVYESQTLDELDVHVDPNPFNTSTSLTINSSAPGPVKISFFSMDGKLIHFDTKDIRNNSMSYTLDSDVLNDYKGIIIYKVASSTHTSIGKLVRQ